MKFMGSWKMMIQKFEEQLSYICFYVERVSRIEPYYLLSSVSFIPFVDYFHLHVVLEYISGLLPAILIISNWLVKNMFVWWNFENYFEIDIGSYCSIDGGWLDFLLLYKRSSLSFLYGWYISFTNQNECQESWLFLA